MYSRHWRILLLAFGLAGCRSDSLENHLAGSFLARLHEAGDRANGRNQRLLNTLHYMVGSGGNRAEDVSIVKLADELHLASDGLRSQIDTLADLLAPEPPGASLPEVTLDRVETLSHSLTQFKTQLSRLSKKNWPFTPGLLRQDTLGPLAAYLREGSVAVARLALTRLRAEVAMAEYEALERLASTIGDLCCFCLPRITPVAAVAASTVQAGSEYQAELFLGTGHRSGWYAWKASLNGKSLSFVQDEAVAVLPPLASTSGPDSQWQLDLHLVHRDGRDSTLVIRRPYPVILPASTPSSPAARP